MRSVDTALSQATLRTSALLSKELMAGVEHRGVEHRMTESLGMDVLFVVVLDTGKMNVQTWVLRGIESSKGAEGLTRVMAEVNKDREQVYMMGMVLEVELLQVLGWGATLCVHWNAPGASTPPK
jgi:hypothetical protein